MDVIVTPGTKSKAQGLLFCRPIRDDVAVSNERYIPVDVDPILIIYQGLDADDGGIDMALLAKSLDGYSRILSTATTFALTFVYQKHMDAMPVRVRVQEVQKGSLTIKAAFDFIKQSKLLPGLQDQLKALLKWIAEKVAGKDTTVSEAIVKQMLENEANRDDKMFQLMDKMVDGLVPAAREASAPIGESCKQITLGQGDDAIVVWDESDRKAIEARVKPTIQPVQEYAIYISELDIATGSAKVTFSDQDDHRVKAKIADPLVFEPKNAYAMALASQRPLVVVAKAEILEGAITLLHVSDAIPHGDDSA